MTESVPFILPEEANIPNQWKLAEDEDHATIVFPSWSQENGTYVSILDKQTRELSCECLGYQFNKVCHHVRGIKWATCKPHKKRGKTGVTGTSIASIRSFSPEQLATNQLAVFDTLCKHGPLSIREISEALRWPEHCVTGRLMEVREMGAVDCAGEKIDQVTGKRVKVWSVV